MARFLVEGHVLGGRPVGELAAAHGVHRSWIYKLLARYREGGYEALEPRSRRPKSCRHATPEDLVRAIVALRERLAREGHDCAAHTIAHHLAQELEDAVPSVSTIWRILRREGLVAPQPQKRPASSLIRSRQTCRMRCPETQHSAGGGIRTPKGLSPPAPKAGVSASSTTPARRSPRVSDRAFAHRDR
jgi:transposase